MFTKTADWVKTSFPRPPLLTPRRIKRRGPGDEIGLILSPLQVHSGEKSFYTWVHCWSLWFQVESYARNDQKSSFRVLHYTNVWSHGCWHVMGKEGAQESHVASNTRYGFCRGWGWGFCFWHKKQRFRSLNRGKRFRIYYQLSSTNVWGQFYFNKAK